MDASYVSVSSFKVLGNLTGEFNVGRRVRCQQNVDGIKYATVSGTSYAAGYTTVVIDESELTSNLTEAHYGIIQTGSIGSMPVHTHQGNEGDGGYLPGFDSFIELLDTPSAYSDDTYLKSTTTGIEFVDIVDDTVAWHHGEGAPAGELGVEGDYYHDDTTDDVYRKDPGVNSTTWNGGDAAAGINLSNGDLTATMAGGSQWDAIRSYFSASSGKWYWEVTVTAYVSVQVFAGGIGTSSEILTYPGDTTEGYSYYGNNGNKYHSSTSSYGDTYTLGDVIGVALDMDNGKIWFSKNGVWQASGNPGSDLNEAYSGIVGTFYAMIGLYGTGNAITTNFGATPFVYAVPNGFTSGFGSITSGVWTLVGTLADTTEILTDMEEPTGFTNYKVGSDIAYNGTEVSISGTYSYYIHGQKYEKDGADNFNINNDSEGDQFVYFDGTTLTGSTIWSNDILSDYSYVAVAYWDNTNSGIIYFGDERHGIIMDSATHMNLHLGEGTRYISGIGITDILTDEDGSSDTHAQFAVSSGYILDEDLMHAVAAESVGDTIPVFYKDGASGLWRTDTQSTFAFLNGTTYPKYNLYSGGSWSQPEIGHTEHVLVHIFATNDLDQNIVAIMGQDKYATSTDARTGANEELNSLSLNGLPFQEFVAVATIILQALSTFGNSVKARTISTSDGDWIDWRRAKINSVPGASTSHSELTGLDANDHPAYVTWDFGSGTISGTGDIYCDDIYTSSGTVWIGDLQLSTADGETLLVNGIPVSGTGGGASGDYIAQDGSTPLTGDWEYGAYTISGTGDMYCNDIYTSSGTVWIGDLQLTTDGENLVAGGTVVSGIIGPQGEQGEPGADGADGTNGTNGIDGVDGSTTLSGLTDTPATYDDGKYLRSTASGTEWSEVSASGWIYEPQTLTTSGTVVELTTSIPASATEIEVILIEVNTNTANQPPMIQLGHSAGYETSGYLTWVQYASTYQRKTDGFYSHETASFTTGESMTGRYIFSRWDPSEHFWYGDGTGGEDTAEGAARRTAGSIEMSGELDRIRLNTAAGTATFNAGKARVRYRS